MWFSPHTSGQAENVSVGEIHCPYFMPLFLIKTLPYFYLVKRKLYWFQIDKDKTIKMVIKAHFFLTPDLSQGLMTHIRNINRFSRRDAFGKRFLCTNKIGAEQAPNADFTLPQDASCGHITLFIIFLIH